jgi:plastocyanin
MRSISSRRAGTALLATALAGTALATGVATAASSLRIDAVAGKLAFTKKKATAKAGSVTLTMKNPKSNSFPHAIAIKGHGIDKKGNVVKGGGTSRLKVTLKKGTYRFYCPVGDHAKDGMKGTLVVR